MISNFIGLLVGENSAFPYAFCMSHVLFCEISHPAEMYSYVSSCIATLSMQSHEVIQSHVPV